MTGGNGTGVAGVFGAAAIAAAWCVPAGAADPSRCAAIAEDGPRLACYDRLAGRAAPAGTSARTERTRVRNEVIERCQRRMGRHGPAMVKGCVDLDLEAHAALADYPVEYKAIVDRCVQRMGRHGWAMVRGCADLDIEAARALESMKNR